MINNSAARYGNVEIISRWILRLLYILTLIEAVFFPEPENIYGCLTFIVAWLILSFFVMRQENVNRCFLPFISIFGLGVCFYFMPLLATILEGKPLTFRFQSPYMTFNYQLLNLVMLVFAYRICMKIHKPTNFLTRLWTKIGYFTPPTENQIWCMGIIGIACQTFLLLIMGTNDALSENLGFVGHLFGVMRVFSCFPILLLYKSLYTGKKSGKHKHGPIIIYLFILMALGLATGKRIMIFSSLLTIAMCYIVPIFSENKKVFTRKTFIIGAFCIYLITGPIADLAAAMALGRDNQSQTGASKTFNNIIKLYQDKEKLHKMYQLSLTTTDNGGDNLSGWSEYYVDNIMLDRFCNLRVCDMTIDYADKLGFDNPAMQEYASNQMLFLIPTPILKYMGIHTNKFDLQYTPGDLISTNALGLRSQYHGYRVAGDVGIGLFLWGNRYFIFAFFIYLSLFYFLSSLVKNSRYGLLLFPLPVLADLFRYFLQFNNATGIIGVLSIILRTGWQTIVVYCVVFFVIKRIIK